MSKAQVKTGHFRGTGSIVNVEVGFIPDLLFINNFNSGTYLHWSWPRQRIIAFTGQSEAVAAGDKIIGATSGASATILEYHLDTGSLASGNGAGWLVLDALSETRTFAAEPGYVENSSTLDDLTLAASSLDGAVMSGGDPVASDTQVTAYKGSITAAQGFTVAAAISTNAKLFTYTAIRNHQS